MNFAPFVPGTMSASLGGPSAQQAAAAIRTRDNMLCQRCRHDKQKCLPKDRNWDRREKCQRCMDRGYECSASEKAPYKPRKRRATSGTSTLHTTISPPASFSQDDNASMHILTPSISEPAPAGSRSRPLLPWEADTQPFLSDDMLPPSSQLDNENGAASARKLAEQEARMSLARLDDLYATRELVRADLHLCDEVETWLGSSIGVSRIREALKEVINAIESDFYARAREAVPIVRRKDIGPFKEYFASHLAFVKYKFRFPPPVESLQSEDIHTNVDVLDDEDGQEKLYALHRKKNVNWSAAGYLFGNALGRVSSQHTIHTHSEGVVVACFMKASKEIKDVISNVLLEKADHRETLNIGIDHSKDTVSAFPPLHLAVSQASAPVLLTLWKKSTMPVWDVDYLGRTPVHSAAYAGRIQGLQNIFPRYESQGLQTGCDAFGLTPLAIAACRDDVRTFIRLIQERAHLDGIGPEACGADGHAMSVFSLAARNGSANVLKFILAHPLVYDFQQQSSELCQALLNNQVHIAHILIDWHCNPNQHYSLSNQIAAAKRVAEEKGLLDVADRLKRLVPTRHDAVQSLEEAEFESFTDYDAFADMLAPYESSQISTSQDFEYDTPIWSTQGSNVSSLAPFGSQNSNGLTQSPSGGLHFMSRSTHARRTGQHGLSGLDPR